jgi:predicted outer membrane repeat protein
VNGNGATIRRSCATSTSHPNGTIDNSNGSTLILRALTVRGGRGIGTGAIRSMDGTGNELYLDGVTVIDNEGTVSGGAISASGYVEVVDSVIAGNSSAGTGGGIHVRAPSPTSGAALSVVDSVVTDNEGASGGGIGVSTNATTQVVGSDVSGNRTTLDADQIGGGIWAIGDLTVFFSTVSENRSTSQGGGIWSGGSLSLLSSTVSGNGRMSSATTDPGGIRAGADVTASFSTIVNNSGVNLRIANSGDLTAFGNVIGGAAPNCTWTGSAGAVDSGGYNVEDDDTCKFGAGPGDREDVADLGLLPLTDNGGSGPSHHPTWTGGLVDTIPVDNAACASILFGSDQRSVDRPVGEGCEPGAVEVSFAPGLLPAHGFSDVPAWVEDAVRWIAYVGVADGFPDGTYGPDLDISRAQVVRMLYRMAGSPSVSGLPAHGLSDVPRWVQDAVRWAAHDPAGPTPPIMAGFPDDTFRPDLSITRAQVVRSLCRMAGAPDVSGYPAHGLTDVPPWVDEAVRWAVRDPAGSALPVMTGYPDDTFRPDLAITRAAVTRALHRFEQLP